MSFFKADDVVFITGAGSGIGQATALQFVDDGIRNVVLIDQSEENLQTTRELVAQKNTEVQTLVITADISKLEHVEHAMKETIDAFNRIDYCVNCAGILGGPGPSAMQTMENVDRILGVNLRGTYLCEQAEIKQFLKQDFRPLNTDVPHKTRGSIVNIASICGQIALPNMGPYNISKHGVIGMVKSDAIDYALEGIRINAVCPGFVTTNLASPDQWKALDPVLAQTPMQRFAVPKEIATIISFLSSDRASYITGSSLTADGGHIAK